MLQSSENEEVFHRGILDHANLLDAEMEGKGYPKMLPMNSCGIAINFSYPTPGKRQSHGWYLRRFNMEALST